MRGLEGEARLAGWFLRGVLRIKSDVSKRKEELDFL
jgi:hypothetical protein